MIMKPSPCHCLNIRRASKAVTDFYDRYLQKCGVTVSQFGVLQAVKRRKDSCISDLAGALRLDRSTLVRNLRPLLAAGLIEDRSLSGTRKRRLHLTKAGEDVIAKGQPFWDSAQRELEEKLGKKNMEELYSSLGKLLEL